MIFFPNAKINFGLNILQKRKDGYHDLESVVYPIPLYDSLEWIEAKETQLKVYTQNIHTLKIERQMDLEASSNLILNAYRLLNRKFDLPPLSLYLLKNIPMGAGLGGGSSNGAKTLLELNAFFKLGISTSALQDYALELGSDCPFFIESIPCILSGRGEILQPITVVLSGYTLIVIKPNFSISTAEAYNYVKPLRPNRTIGEIIQLPLIQWKDLLKNDFEDSLFPRYPELEKIKLELYRQGAIYASLSGSGSAMFGIFDQEPGKIQFPAGCTSFNLKL